VLITTSFPPFLHTSFFGSNFLGLTFNVIRMENQVQLIGNLGMNPEAKNINDTVKATFTLATNTVYRDSDGNKKTMTDWHNIVAWGGLAQTIEQYVKKGDKIGISGRLVTRSYEDEKGNKKYFTEVIARDMLLLGNKKSGEN